MVIDSATLEALHRAQNDQVLAITVHIQVNPLRVSFLDANGELYTAADTPSPQRVMPAGFVDGGFGWRQPE